MRCYVKGRIKTGSDTIAIDYIEAKNAEVHGAYGSARH